jgi:LCP family protein required for cell wall assembly
MAKRNRRQRPGPERGANKRNSRHELRRHYPRRRRISLISFLGFALGLCVGGLFGSQGKIYHSTLKAFEYTVDPQLFNNQRVLVLGTDASSGSTDVMFTIQSDGDKTRILQIPRDTLIDSKRFGVVKANALYSVGGPKEVESEVERLVGGRLEHFARVNLNAFDHIADTLGGVKINVPIRMKYDDISQSLHIDLYPGNQLLKGKALEGYVRFRHDGLGDIGRMERQKEVYTKLFYKVLSPAALIHLPGLIKDIRDGVKTDLSPLEIGAMMGLMKGNHLYIARLEGRPIWYKGVSYWMANSFPDKARFPEDPN